MTFVGVGAGKKECLRRLLLAGRVVHGVQEQSGDLTNHRPVGNALCHAVQRKLALDRLARVLHDLRRTALNIGNEFVRNTGLCVHVRYANVNTMKDNNKLQSIGMHFN